jgi:hypothetical protein
MTGDVIIAGTPVDVSLGGWRQWYTSAHDRKYYHLPYPASEHKRTDIASNYGRNGVSRSSLH